MAAGEPLTGYKVLERAGRVWVSPASPRPLVYQRKRPTRPKAGDGPLGVYEDVTLARSWLKNLRTWDWEKDFAIWLCEYAPWNRPFRKVQAWCVSQPMLLSVDFWICEVVGKQRLMTRWEQFKGLGTALASKVTILRRLRDDG